MYMLAFAYKQGTTDVKCNNCDTLEQFKKNMQGTVVILYRPLKM